MSFLSDIAELAKAGYKPQDVKDLLSMSKPETPGASPLPGEPSGEPLCFCGRRVRRCTCGLGAGLHTFN